MVLPARSIIGFCRLGQQDAGYAMAALLVTMSVMTIMLSVAMPTWSHMIRREREEELIFRGEQYARAINSYQRKYANQSPANLDVLIKERMLRKKFKDPLSPNMDGEFQLLYFQTGTGPQGGGTQGAGTQGTGARGTGGSGTGSQGPGSRGTGAGGGQSGSIGPSSGMGRGAVVGVVSKNTGQSIRTYKGRNRYSEWQFIGMELSQRAGGPGGAAGGRGGPGGRSGTQGGRGGPTGTDRGGRGSGTVYTTPDGGTTFTPRGGASSGPR